MSSSADSLFDWLLDGAPGATQSIHVVERLGVDLNAAGVPVDHTGVFVTTLHPTVFGRRFRWRKGDPKVTTYELTAAIQASPAYTESPVYQVTAHRATIHQRLDGPPPAKDYAVFHEMRAEGYTDYFAEPLVFTNDETHAVTFATRSPEGFTAEHIAIIKRIGRPLARLAEIFALRRVASNLLDTYVGRHCGDRILSGRITKGDIETLRAIIWFSDLRGFTAMSARSTPREIVDTLNELFECQVPAIERHGGEVLKFIGDGMLAIFPLEKDDIAKRCKDALDAADEAFTALDERNEKSKTAMQFGLALHVGDVAYGNIGGASRLDFTAIGPAVNVAARLEGLTGKLGQSIVLSSDLAAHAGMMLEDLGEFDLKGVPDKQGLRARARAFSSSLKTRNRKAQPQRKESIDAASGPGTSLASEWRAPPKMTSFDFGMSSFRRLIPVPMSSPLSWSPHKRSVGCVIFGATG